MKSFADLATMSQSMTPSTASSQTSGNVWVPRVGQKAGMKFLLAHAAAIVAADPGVGKTTITYGAFKVLRRKGLAKKMLVIAPLKPAYLVWPPEAAKWDDFKDLKVAVLHGEGKTEAAIKDADVCVINPAGLDWLLGATRRKSPKGRVSATIDTKRLRSFGFDTLVIDELTRFKHAQSGRFKVLKGALPFFQRRWGLTGSLVANGLMDLFGQCYCVDLGRALGEFITHYRVRYFERGFDGFTWSLKEGAETQIYDRVAPLVLRLSNEGLPDVVVTDIVFDLDARTRAIYDRLEEDMIAKIDDKVITAATAAAASIKCRQVAAGGIYLDPELAEFGKEFVRSSKREWINLHTTKAELVESLVEELQGSPLLVAYDFQHDLDRLRKVLGNDVPYIGGGVPPSRFKELEKAWNRGELSVLLGHPQSVAHGLNIQESGYHIAWHSLTWDFELYDQFIRRIRRPGQKAKRVFVHRFIAKDTVDEQMIASLQAKDSGQQALYKALVDLAKKRRRRK